MNIMENKSETGILATQLASLHTNEQNKAEHGVDISHVEVKPTRGRKNWRRVGLKLATARAFSTIIDKSRDKKVYRNPLTGEKIEWSERPMDDKVC